MPEATRRRASPSSPASPSVDAAAPTAKPRGRPRKQPSDSYHHGDLPQTLLAAAETVLRRDGLNGLGLRAIAREAGVSHTAPKHHFGDTRALMSQLAAVGFWRLRDAMLQAQHGLAPGRDARLAIGEAYVRFAHTHPELFALMFRNEIADVRHPALVEAQRAAMRAMTSTISGLDLPESSEGLHLSATVAVQVTAAWAMVHGLASLLIDERLGGIVRSSDAFADPLALSQATLLALRDFVPGSAAPAAPSQVQAPTASATPPRRTSTKRTSAKP